MSRIEGSRMSKPRLPIGTLVRVIRDLHAYPVSFGTIGTVVNYHGEHVYPWAHPEPTHCYVVRFATPHQHGDTLNLNDHEIEPVD